MKINKVLIIAILIITITIIILAFKTQENITNKKKFDIPKIVIPKVTISQTTAQKKEDELLKIVSDLKSIIEEDEIIQQNRPTEDEVQNILSDLKALKLIEKKREKKKRKKKKKKKKKKRKKKKRKVVVKKSKVPIKRRVYTRMKRAKKRPIEKDIKPKKIIIYKEVVIEKPSTQEESILTAEEYRIRLAKESKVDEDIASLSIVKIVDMDIEQKIKEGKERKLTTPKPLVEQKTIFIPSSQQKIDDDIPWAELKDVNEKVDGIFIKELIN
jgi:hypothetical protein